MGRYDSSDEEYERRKKKLKKHGRSRSKSSDRKSKHKKQSSSRSRRHHSGSRSKDGRSYSRRSRSSSRDRRRSRSRGRYRSRERSPDHRRSRSRSGSSYRHRRSRSRSRRKDSPGHSSATSREHSSSRSGTESMMKSFADMTPSEQNQARMQLAIEKAKAADEAIRQRHGIDDEEPVDTKKRQKAFADIESEGFSQQKFSSSRDINQSKKKEAEFSFGTSRDFIQSAAKTHSDPDSLMHSRFSEDEGVRKQRWNEQLKQLRIQFAGS